MADKSSHAPVRRRHVIYVPGYDPRGLAEYFRMFRSGYPKFTALYGLEGRMGKPVSPADRFSTMWKIDTKGRDWQVETTYEFLRWEDIIRRDFERPMWWKILHAFIVWAQMFTSGVFPRFVRAGWQMSVFLSYPFLVAIALALLSGLLGLLVMQAADALALPAPLPQAAGLAAAAGVFAYVARKAEPQTYMLYLFDDHISTKQFALRRRPDWEERLQVFAGYVVEAARGSGADEIVIVGHSSGSFLAVDVLDRALALDPQLGRHGPRVALLTVGANLPIVGFYPEAQWFRDRLARLAAEPSIDWIEYQARKDVMNFYPFDPIAGHGLDVGAARRNPIVKSISFHDIIKPESYRDFRWRFFRVHFQFVMANELRAAYDFYMIACGPFSLPHRAARPAEVLAAVTGTD